MREDSKGLVVWCGQRRKARPLTSDPFGCQLQHILPHVQICQPHVSAAERADRDATPSWREVPWAAYPLWPPRKLSGGSQMLADGRSESAEKSLQKRKVELKKKKKHSNSSTCQGKAEEERKAAVIWSPLRGTDVGNRLRRLRPGKCAVPHRQARASRLGCGSPAPGTGMGASSGRP